MKLKSDASRCFYRVEINHLFLNGTYGNAKDQGQPTDLEKKEWRGPNPLTGNISHKHRNTQSLGAWGRDKPKKPCSSLGDSGAQKH